VNFLVTVKKYCHDLELSSEIFVVGNPYAGHNPGIDPPEFNNNYHLLGMACFAKGFVKPGSTGLVSDPVGCGDGVCGAGETTATCPLDCRPKDFQSFTYPIAVDCVQADKAPLKGMGLINIIVWKRGV
jgi:hypothetical protein